MRRVYRRRRIVAGLVLLGIVGGTWLGVRALLGGFEKPSVEVVGLLPGNLLGKDAAADVVVKAPASSQIRVDGSVKAAGTSRNGRAEARTGPLGEGKHTVSVAVRRALRPDQHRAISFTVDLTPPTLQVEKVNPVGPATPAKITGRVEKGAALSIEGKEITNTKEAFALDVTAPAPPLTTLIAVDRAGNRTEVPVSIPSVQPPVRAVHLTEIAWTTPSLKGPAMQMLADKQIDAIQLDIKDEGGEIGYDTKVSLAHEIGAVKKRFDLGEAVSEIHQAGGRVIGRIVTYRDPIFAGAAWGADRKEQLIQTPDGQRYGAYGGGFLNPLDPAVRQYTTDLATEAVTAKVDEVLLDYVRRPDGALSSMRFPGARAEGDAVEKEVEDTIVGHLVELHRRVRLGGGRLGASVFGIAATRPQQIAQDIPRMAQHLDYVAPMLYPSHWNKGEYGVPDPNRAPGEIIRRSMADFGKAIEGTGAGLVPWLQDFSLGVTYGPKEVRAQIDAATDTGADGFLLWDAACTYTTAALDAKEDKPART